jgi:hypothetical protein
MEKILYWLIIIIAAFAIYGTSGLVLKEWNIGNICPKILGIPACFIVMVCFLGGLIGHLTANKTGLWIFFVFTGVVTLIAITGTVGELTGTTKCPRTSGGIPMCFISLGICLSLLIAKIAHLKL